MTTRTHLLDGDCARAQRGRLWLFYPDNPSICINARFLDRVLADDAALVLTLDGSSAVLTVPQGDAVAVELARELSAFTRSAQISDEETYEYTKELLTACTTQRRYTGDFVVVDGEPVRATDEMIYVGEFACYVADAEAYAEAAACLPLPNGQLQAALAMLVVTQWRRLEDKATLSRRVAEYERAHRR